jgi:hypothetical protein
MNKCAIGSKRGRYIPLNGVAIVIVTLGAAAAAAQEQSRESMANDSTASQ